MVVFDDVNDALEKALRTQRDRHRQQEMRRAAEHHTWCHHTWSDRIGELLEQISKLTTPQGQEEKKVEIMTSTITFWEKRAQNLGPRAVGYFK